MSGQIAEDYLGVNRGYRSDVDYLDCVDGFHHGGTIKRLSLKRRPRVAASNVEKTQSGISSGQWRSAESLSSSSDDARLLGMSSATKGRPPLPPPYASSPDSKHSRSEGAAAPQPAARAFTSQRQSAAVEKTIVDMQKPLDQEGLNPPQPQPHPRRRLASFGGVSSPGSLSPFTGLGAYNQNDNGNKPTGTGSDTHVHLSSSLGSRGSTGSLKLSPQSSGRTTPVTSHGSTHLQHVRDQMMVALQRLKELEEQVKIIPILYMKISVLQEEKRQLVSQLSNQTDDGDENNVMGKRACGTERPDVRNKEGGVNSDNIDLGEFKLLSEEIRALENTIQGSHLQAWHGTSLRPLHDNASKSFTVRMDKDAGDTLSKPLKETKSVHTDAVAMRSIATEVSEAHLGIYTQMDAELDSRQQKIGALEERIFHLEAELKESALQTEMSRLKLELQAAGARNRADKASSVRPSTVSTGVEAKIHTTSRGVGNHTDLRDASTGKTIEMMTVGVSCHRTELKDVCSGPIVPMSHWEVKRRAETVEKGTGIHVFTNTQGVGTEIKLYDAETNTDTPMDSPASLRGKIQYNSVACGDCSVHVTVCEAKEVVSQGVATDSVKGTDLGIMASPKMASQRTNTISSSVSRFTNTRNAFNMDSSTNTVICTKDKHTSTTQTVTRTVSVGGRVTDMKCVPKSCTVGVGTSNLQSAKQILGTVPKVTRDIGVGFTNIHENYLVGLKMRNMASGPSRLPDPVKTRSVGVGEGRIWDLLDSSGKPGPVSQQCSHSQWDPELNHYIEKMHRLLGGHGDPITQKSNRQRDGFVLETSTRGSTRSTLSYNDRAGAEDQPAVGRDTQSPSQLSLHSSECDEANPEFCQQGENDSEVRRMVQMLERQASSALRDGSANVSLLRSGTRKKNGDQSCSSSRKSMKFLRATTGLEPAPSFDFSASENSEEVEKRGNKRSRVASQDATLARKGKSGSGKGSKGSKSPTRQRSQLSDRMLAACQALKRHLVDSVALSSRDLHDCLQAIQQEWFSVSSQKSAAPETVEDHLSAFWAISPSVLQCIANMADGNGNTALHYSVSHSNFGIVKKLLDAEVCKVNQQNKAGYTPVMLAALAAVERQEDMRVVERLFSEADVNAKASQAGQTALMLAVSHGRMGMVRALLARGAEVNLQDDEGSTALMCACEHGHADIVRLLLTQPGCNAALTDSDESTALSIALEAGHNDIAVLLYAHSNYSKGPTGVGRTLSSSGGRNVFE